MVRIISDTSTMYSTKQAEEAGFSVSPLAVLARAIASWMRWRTSATWI